MYQNQCPEYFLHVGPELGHEFWMAGDTAGMNNPAGRSRRQRGKRTKTGNWVSGDEGGSRAKESRRKLPEWHGGRHMGHTQGKTLKELILRLI